MDSQRHGPIKLSWHDKSHAARFTLDRFLMRGLAKHLGPFLRFNNTITWTMYGLISFVQFTPQCRFRPRRITDVRCPLRQDCRSTMNVLNTQCTYLLSDLAITCLAPGVMWSPTPRFLRFSVLPMVPLSTYMQICAQEDGL